MPSINSLMGSSSASSIYGSRNANIISGLASGLDTESMIQGLVDSYQQKIIKLTKNRTKLQWQQEAYQNVSNKLVEFYRNYMSFAYNSSNNLASSSFFSSASKVITGGAFADKVTASGSSSSTILLKSVAQLAKAARYTTSGGVGLDTGAVESGGKLTATGGAMVEETHMNKLEGTIELKFGGDKTLSIDLGTLDLVGKNKDGTGALDPSKLENAINEQLKKQTITINGNTYTGDQAVKVGVSADGAISFSENKDHITGGNSVTVTSVSGKLAGALEAAPNGKENSIKLKAAVKDDPTETLKTAEALTGKKVTVTLDGKTKTFILGESLGEGKKFGSLQDVADDLKKQVGDAFGDSVTVKFEGGKLSFQVKSGSSLSVTSEAGELLGLGEHGLTSYINTSKSLGELLGDKMGNLPSHAQKTTTAIKEVKAEDGTVTYQDANGNKVDKDGYFLEEDGTKKQFYDLTINGKLVGSFSKDSTLQSVLNTVNNSNAGVEVQFSKITNQFVFTAKETGEAGRIEIGDGLGKSLFGDQGKMESGQDAIFQVEVNGTTMNLARSSNSVEIDGMTLNFQGTFNTVETAGGDDGIISGKELAEAIQNNKLDGLFGKGEAVTFTAKADTDKVVDAVKKMVEDYNTLLTTVKDLYSTQPLTDSKGKPYEPLTDADREGMSDKAIEAYEEKAKTGLLFMDHDLSSLYNSLRSTLTANSGLLKSVGLSTSYSNGTTTLKLDENALKEALEKDPEAVKDAFTKRKDNGATEDGLMASIQNVVDRFAATSGATKGILIEKAGSKYSPSSALDNTMLDKLNEMDGQIAKWQDKMAGQVDFYNNKFTQLEMLINQMNSQSSALAGLMGGGGM